MIAAHVVKIADATDLNNVRGLLGASDLAGQLRMQDGEGRQTITGHLTAHTLQRHDLTVLSKNNGSKQTTSLRQPESVFPPSLPVDVDLDVVLHWRDGPWFAVSHCRHAREGQVLLYPIQNEEPRQLAAGFFITADLITTALSTAWEKEPVTNLNCMVGYFDIEEGILKSENILIGTSRLPIVGVGKLNLTDETLDMILTPRPKDPGLLTLAHTVRITGPIEGPVVSSDEFRIAESGGRGLLGLATPVGWGLRFHTLPAPPWGR